MMTDTFELDYLVRRARALGATVVVTYEPNDEGRRLYKSITVTGLRGIGPHPMSPINAAEALRPVVEGSQLTREQCEAILNNLGWPFDGFDSLAKLQHEVSLAIDCDNIQDWTER